MAPSVAGVPSSPARGGATAAVRALVPDVPALQAALAAEDYLADEGLATALFLAVLGADRLDPQHVVQTWGSRLKNRDDLDLAHARGAGWLAGS